MRAWAVIILILAAWFAGAPATEAGDLRLAGVSIPQPARGKGDSCVAETDFMRRNHMKLLDHQRDGTLHDGLRPKRFSLKGCIDCHAVNGADGTPVTVKDPKHFCRTCHDYAAVRVDCFECHASRPENAAGTAEPVHGKRIAALANYLEGLKP